MWDNDYQYGRDFSVLLGQTIVSITNGSDDDKPRKSSSEVHIKTKEGNEYKMYHEQDCCENVAVEDIEGEWDDLIGTPLTQAEVASKAGDQDEEEYQYGTSTWTFYKLATVKGYVTLRWYGESNGYYSESVDTLCRLIEE